MANNDVKIPKFYPDIINHLMATGTAQNGNFDLMSGTDLISTLNAGSEAELFDMNPLNQVHFETSASSSIRADHVLLNINTGGDYTIDFVAIFNHNLNSCNGKFRIAHAATAGAIDSVTEMEDGTATRVNNVTEVVNGDSISNNIVIPAENGSTIVTFDENDAQYWGIQFEGNTSFDSSNDLKIGCVLLGESYTLPHAPDINVKRTIVYDGVNLQESLGGQRYTVSTQTGKQFVNSNSKSPFVRAANQARVYNGRLGYEFSASYLNSSDVMPPDYSQVVANETTDSVVADLYNRTLGNRIPFCFTTDSTSTSEADYMFARFVENSIEMTQVAYTMYNVSFKIEEEY